MGDRAPSSRPPEQFLHAASVVSMKKAAPKKPPPAGMANFKPKAMGGEGVRDGFTLRRDRTVDDYEDNEMSDEELYQDDSPYKSDFKSVSSFSTGVPRNVRHMHSDDEEESIDISQRNMYSEASFADEKPSPTGYYRRATEDEFASTASMPATQVHKKAADQPVKSAVKELRYYNFNNLAAPAGAKPANNSSSNNSPNGTKFFNFSSLVQATYRELKVFVNSQCEPGVIARCYIERNRSGTNMIAPFYSLCADLEDGTGRELIVCKKVNSSLSAHYVFSLKHDDLYRKREQRSKLYLGKLRSTSDNEYILYDGGDLAVETPNNSEEINFGQLNANRATFARNADLSTRPGEANIYRKELAIVKFNSKKRPAPLGSRPLEVCIPTVSANQQRLLTADPKTNLLTMNPQAKGSSGSDEGVATVLWQGFEKVVRLGKQNSLYADKITVLHERVSRYDALSACLVDFHGRANVVSVKNYQLIMSTPEADVDSKSSDKTIDDEANQYVLQMGKTTNDCFNMDYKFPLSMLQAFAICIARFDAKLT